MLLHEALEQLELTDGASRSEIRHAYARLSKIYHIETHPAEFARLHEAYRVALAAEGTENTVPDPRTEAETDFASAQKDAPEAKTAYGSAQAPETPPEIPGLTDPLPLLRIDFSIENCSELTQLLYYRCRYDEIPTDLDAALLSMSGAKNNADRDAFSRTDWKIVSSLPDRKKFLGVFWETWKSLNFTCIVCHPDFYRMQNTPAFLTELYRFLQEETLNLRNGIRQELYFALCMAYNFFSPEQETPKEPPHSPLHARMEALLSIQPNHREYLEDLELWADCKEARRIVLFFHEVYDCFTHSDHLFPGAEKNPDSCFCTTRKSPAACQFYRSILKTAAELLLDDEIPWKAFLYDCLIWSAPIKLARPLAAKRKKFRRIYRLRQEFSQYFLHLLDHRIAENQIYGASYLPLSLRLDVVRRYYLSRKDWKKIICRPAFFQAFKEWILPSRGFSSVPCLVHYDAWKMLRTCFAGSSPFEENCTRYLTGEFYFPEYEKRYKRELGWEAARIEKAYFQEIFPISPLSQEKRDLLRTVRNASPVGIEEIEKIFGNLTFDSAGFDFLGRIANAMTHFNFLLVTPKREKDAVAGDAFCFLEDEVLLYRKKENRVCRLTHPVFYDLISWKFESAAYHVITGRMGYSEEFLDTALKNLYYYRCYVEEYERRKNQDSGQP